MADLGEAAGAVTDQVDVLDEHHGPATVVAATATYEGMDPTEVIVETDHSRIASRPRNVPNACST